MYSKGPWPPTKISLNPMSDLQTHSREHRQHQIAIHQPLLDHWKKVLLKTRWNVFWLAACSLCTLLWLWPLQTDLHPAPAKTGSSTLSICLHCLLWLSSSSLVQIVNLSKLTCLLGQDMLSVRRRVKSHKYFHQSQLSRLTKKTCKYFFHAGRMLIRLKYGLGVIITSPKDAVHPEPPLPSGFIKNSSVSVISQSDWYKSPPSGNLLL